MPIRSSSTSDSKEIECKGYLLMTPPILKGSGRCSSVSLCESSSDEQTVVVWVRDASFMRGLYCSVGIVDSDSGVTNWGPGRVEYATTGQHPSVCLYKYDSKQLYAIECHSTDFYMGQCSCCVGKVDIENKEIEWNKESLSIGSGVKPKVCVNENGMVVIIFEEKWALNTLRYLVGSFGKEKIEFYNNLKSKEIKVEGGGNKVGVEPDIAIQGNTVAVIYRSLLCNNINTVIGTLDGDTITWCSVQAFGAKGIYPSISIHSGNVVETHQINYWKRLSTRCGKLHDGKIDWRDIKELDYGEYPAVALYKKKVFQVHTAPLELNLFYSQGELCF